MRRLPVDAQIIEALQAAARRERSEYVHCLFQRAWIWMKSLLPGADAGVRTAPCC